MILAAWPGAPAMRLLAGTGLLAAGLALGIIDLRTQRLPDRIVLPLLGAGLGLNAATLFTTPTDALLGAAVGYALLRIPGHAYGLAHAGRPCFGGGDVKLAAAMGAWFGVQGVVLTLLLAFLAGACAVLPGLALGRRALAQRVPFGPAIVLGAGAVLLLGRPAILRFLLGTA